MQLGAGQIIKAKVTFEPTSHLWCSSWHKTIIIAGHKQTLISYINSDIFLFLFFFHLSDTNNPDFLISFFAIQRQLGVGTDWTPNMQTGKQTELRYSYRFICNESYYGESCSKKCTPRDDRFGHYTCTREGQLSCLPGWKGKYCEERKQSTKYPKGLFTPISSPVLVDFVTQCCSELVSVYFFFNTRGSSRCLQMTQR